MAPTDSPEHELDLALAAQLQAALLPKQCPADCPHQAVAARNRMCGSVGGDFYDFLRLNEDQIAVLIGDVAGHGVTAALIMAQIMGYLRSQQEARARPARIVSDLNRILIDLGERTEAVTPCSLFYGVIDAPTGAGFFVNAGHPPPYLCDPERCATLSAHRHDLLLGVQEFDPQELCLTFHPGQRLVLYTDGVPDAMNGKAQHFGERRLRQVVSRHIGAAPQQCADAVFDAVEEFRGRAPQTDDETIVVIDRK